jgi:hypothetical protein
MCTPQMFMRQVGRLCDPGDSTCYLGCEDPYGGACVEACLGSVPECQSCIVGNLYACVIDGGCESEFAAFDCCVQADPTMGACDAERDAFRTCADAVDATGACASIVDDCTCGDSCP